jgi:hypothetical protein
MKHPPELKAEILASIASIGIKETIKIYTQSHPIRGEIIRIWADPEKQKRWRRKAKALYDIRKADKKFMEVRRLRSISNRQKNITAAVPLLPFERLDLSYAYPEGELKSQFNLLQASAGRFDSDPCYNKIVLTYQPHYYALEKQMWKNDPVLRARLVANREKYLFKTRDKLNDKEILRGFKISGEHIGFSHFSPLWIKAFIEKYDVKSIYDPCGGWGHRLLGAAGIKYIYNDLDVQTCNGVKKIATDFNINASFYNQDAALLTPIEDYEAVFTCPPYFNAEIYSNGPFKDLNAYASWWMDVIKHSIKPVVKYFAFVINNDYKQLLKDVTEQQGLILIDEIAVGRNRLNHFQRVATQRKKGEFLLVFNKK